MAYSGKQGSKKRDANNKVRAEVNARVREFRMSLGLTLKEMAERMGESLGVYQSHEATGWFARSMPYASLAKLGAMGANLNYLICGVGSVTVEAKSGDEEATKRALESIFDKVYSSPHRAATKELAEAALKAIAAAVNLRKSEVPAFDFMAQFDQALEPVTGLLANQK
jgi:transcriptional regulator with XRE-family HTH domain